MNVRQVSVIVPAFRQAEFIERAIDSLIAQSMQEWEAWVIDDASPDETRERVNPYLQDPRIQYLRLEENEGLGKVVNRGLDLSNAPLIAYLPADDVFYEGHLEALVCCLENDKLAVLAYSGVRHHYNRYASGQIEGYPLQMVQVMHRRFDDRWMERSELVTDDLDRMYWEKLRLLGGFIGTGEVTCEWVSHPKQRHLLLREPEGGINPYRVYTGAKEPLRFHTTVGNCIDEVEHYRRFRERPDTQQAEDGLKILMVGELAYNADRVLALEERGHRLYGLWMPDPYWYNTVGPLPFGHVTDLPRENWQQAVKELQPDVIYALLNWQAVPWAHHVLSESQDIPFIWHFKEGPFISLEKGHWKEDLDLYRYSDGQIFTSPEMRDWYRTILPGSIQDATSLVLDGDLPKWDWFEGQASPRLSESDGEFHTVVPGRPIGLHPQDVAALAEQRIHLHFYGDFTHGQWLEWIGKTQRLAGDYIHLHSQVDQEGWVEEFSRYDAGWLHFFESRNGGDIRRADWDDLNYPARMATLASAGLPMLQRDNSGSIVAIQNLCRQLNIGIFFNSMSELQDQLSDKSHIDEVRANVWKHREYFSFDYHADRLVDFFRSVIQERGR